MRVGDLIEEWVVSATPDESLVRAADRMRRHGVGCLVVFDGERLTGILSERDLLVACALGADTVTERVGDHLTADPETVDADADVSLAAAKMAGLHSRHLPVVRRGRVVGVISVRDVIEARTPLTELPGRRPGGWTRLLQRRPRRVGALDARRDRTS